MQLNEFRVFRTVAILCFMAALSACATRTEPAARGVTPHYKIGAPYKVNGRIYTPRADPDYDAVGVASWYGPQFHGKPTANGERFDRNLLSAAHTTLPLPSLVEVRNLENGRRTIVRVNDRGPFVGDRLIDLSEAAAKELGFREQGLARVRVRYIGPADIRQAAAQPKISRTAGGSRTGGNVLPVASANHTDEVAQLIERHTATSEKFERWIELALFAAGEAIDSAPAIGANLGPVIIVSSHAQGTSTSSLRIGPFRSEAEALAVLEASRGAGYPGAKLIAVGHSEAIAQCVVVSAPSLSVC